MKLNGVDEERIKKSDTEHRRERNGLDSALKLINGDDSAVKQTVNILPLELVRLESKSG